MTTANAREPYQEAWDRLFELLLQRNKLMGRLDMMSGLVREVTPATGMVIEFDTGRARRLLDDMDTLAPRISVAIEEVNHYAEKIGKPIILWKRLTLDSDN